MNKGHILILVALLGLVLSSIACDWEDGDGEWPTPQPTPAPAPTRSPNDPAVFKELCLTKCELVGALQGPQAKIACINDCEFGKDHHEAD